MRDLSGVDLDRVNSLRASLGGVMSAAGYVPTETSILEQGELFVSKSGGDIS